MVAPLLLYNRSARFPQPKRARSANRALRLAPRIADAFGDCSPIEMRQVERHMQHRELKTFSFSFALCFVVVSIATAQVPAKPQYGAWGFDSAGADLSTKPGDNFFRYANGTWVDKTQIPPDKPAYSLRLAMTDTTEQRLHDILEAAGSGADATIGDISRQSWCLLPGIHGRGGAWKS